jgi:hypothetical protein
MTNHRTWQAGEWWVLRGYDPAFGRKLPALFEHYGLENTLDVWGRRCEVVRWFASHRFEDGFTTEEGNEMLSDP